MRKKKGQKSPLHPEQEIRGLLGVTCGPDHIGRRAVPDVPEPPRDVGGLVVEHRHIDPAPGAEERGPHLGGEFLPGIPLAPEPHGPGDPRPVQPGGVPGPVGEFVEERRVELLRGLELVHPGE